jgi:hypothetical protein
MPGTHGDRLPGGFKDAVRLARACPAPLQVIGWSLLDDEGSVVPAEF